MRDDPALLADEIETVFRRIERTAMAGMPLLNGALRVEVAGIRPAEDCFLAALVTPWFMNLMLMPREPVDNGAPAGEKTIVALPGGRFEFMQARDDALGPYRLCSVFSPMFDFADQESAIVTAREILSLVSARSEAEEDRDAAMVAIWEGRLPTPAAAAPAAPTLSRRRLFGLPAGKETGS